MEHERIVDKPTKTTQITWPTETPSDEVEEEHSGLNILSHLLEDFNVENTQQAEQPKRQPTNLFDSKEQYLAFRTQWAKLALGKKLTSSMIVFYNLARGKNPDRGFTPITNHVKLTNGAKASGAYEESLASVRYIALPKNQYAEKERTSFLAIFEGTVNEEFMIKVANYLPSV